VPVVEDEEPILERSVWPRPRRVRGPLRRHRREALAAAAQELPDLILLDLMLPGIGGLKSVAASRRGRPRTSRSHPDRAGRRDGHVAGLKSRRLPHETLQPLLGARLRRASPRAADRRRARDLSAANGLTLTVSGAR
jgi:CheY-like chemotaxis protein